MPVINSPSLPLTIDLNGEPRNVHPGSTVASLLAELGVEPRHVAVELNLDVIPRAKHAQQHLADGDRIEVVTLVGGG